MEPGGRGDSDKGENSGTIRGTGSLGSVKCAGVGKHENTELQTEQAWQEGRYYEERGTGGGGGAKLQVKGIWFHISLGFHSDTNI